MWKLWTSWKEDLLPFENLGQAYNWKVQFWICFSFTKMCIWKSRIGFLPSKQRKENYKTFFKFSRKNNWLKYRFNQLLHASIAWRKTILSGIAGCVNSLYLKASISGFLDVLLIQKINLTLKVPNSSRDQILRFDKVLFCRFFISLERFSKDWIFCTCQHIKV